MPTVLIWAPYFPNAARCLYLETVTQCDLPHQRIHSSGVPPWRIRIHEGARSAAQGTHDSGYLSRSTGDFSPLHNSKHGKREERCPGKTTEYVQIRISECPDAGLQLCPHLVFIFFLFSSHECEWVKCILWWPDNKITFSLNSCPFFTTHSSSFIWQCDRLPPQSSIFQMWKKKSNFYNL